MAIARWTARLRGVGRLARLAAGPRRAWQELAGEPAHPAMVLLPEPALFAAVGPVGFLLAHLVGGPDLPALSAGRALGFAVVYYVFLMGLLVAGAWWLGRVAAALGLPVDREDALKLSVWSGAPFLLSGVVLLFPVGNWDSVVVVAGLAGLGYGGYWLYCGLEVFGRGVERRAAGLVAAATVAGVAAVWIVGLFGLAAIVL